MKKIIFLDFQVKLSNGETHLINSLNTIPDGVDIDELLINRSGFCESKILEAFTDSSTIQLRAIQREFFGGEKIIDLEFKNSSQKFEVLHDPSDYRAIIDCFLDNENQLFMLELLMNSLRQLGLTDVVLNCLHIPYMRQDHGPLGQSQSLKVITSRINSLGFSKVIILDPHSDVVTSLLDTVHVISTRLLPYYEVPSKGNWSFLTDRVTPDILLAPDASALKRLEHDIHSGIIEAEGMTVVGANKFRDPETGELKTNFTSPVDMKNKVVLIKDDIFAGGGTFVQLAKLLKEQFSGVKIIVQVAHAVPTREELDDSIDLLVSSDSTIDSANRNSWSRFCSSHSMYEESIFTRI